RAGAIYDRRRDHPGRAAPHPPGPDPTARRLMDLAFRHGNLTAGPPGTSPLGETRKAATATDSGQASAARRATLATSELMSCSDTGVPVLVMSISTSMRGPLIMAVLS